MDLSSFHSRIRILATCVFLFACILVLKLFFISVIHKNDYSERADRQYATPSGDMFNRGDIFLTKHDGTVVSGGTVISGFKVAINNKNIVDPEALYQSLSPYLAMTHDEFITRASKKNDPYEEVIFKITKEQADQISALKLPGVSIYKQKWRFYPGGSMGAHALGFVSFKGDKRVGQYGLEKFYNSTLSKPDDGAYVNFFAEVFSNIGKSFSNVREGDIVTSIDPTTQNTLEEQLRDAMSKWHGDTIGGIIMDPYTGEIYAMSTMPDFDLNDFGKVKDPRMYGNVIVEGVYEFGSVIKPLVVAAALDKGVITPETTYLDKGSVTVNKQQIYNFDKKARGVASMQTVLDQSLNTGMVFIENRLGHETFRNYMKAYGIGEKTGIDLPNETSGLIRNLDSPRDVEYATASFGQGIAMTPIEAIRAFASLANGGTLVTPHLVREIRYDDGTVKKLDFPPAKTGLLSKEATNTASRMLVHVFDKSYGGGAYKFEHYTVATKTGTAQVARDDGKGYYEDQHMHSFFGYFPAYEPRFIVFLFIKNPKGVQYAAQSLIPPFVNITKFLINYYNIPPDR